uniref:Uncharacterized protein n=1 Tax=Hippocampus comes TaxID=109280 RepID=A0A3Q3E698_HIPCM
SDFDHRTDQRPLVRDTQEDWSCSSSERMCSGLLNRVCLGRIRVAPTVATLAVVLGCCLVGRRRCCWRDGGFSGQPWDSHRKNPACGLQCTSLWMTLTKNLLDVE